MVTQGSAGRFSSLTGAKSTVKRARAAPKKRGPRGTRTVQPLTTTTTTTKTLVNTTNGRSVPSIKRCRGDAERGGLAEDSESRHGAKRFKVDGLHSMVEDIRRRWDPDGTLTSDKLRKMIAVQRHKVGVAEMELLTSTMGMKASPGDVVVEGEPVLESEVVSAPMSVERLPRRSVVDASPSADCGSLSGIAACDFDFQQTFFEGPGYSDVMDFDFSSVVDVDLLSMPPLMSLPFLDMPSACS